MRMEIKSPTTVLLMALAMVSMVSLLGIACQPPGQPPVSQTALQEIVRAEVSSQIAVIAIDDRNGPRELEALRAEIELALAEPLIQLEGELEYLRNEYFGEDYASKLDIEGLGLELEQVRSLFDTVFDTMEFEYARRDQLDELRLEIDNVRFSGDPQAEFNLRSDLDQFNFEFLSMQNEFEKVGRHLDLELDQLRLETEEVRRLVGNVEQALRNEIDSLHRRIDAVR